MNESIVKTIGVAFAVCLICSLVVSASAVSLRDLQKENKLNDKRIKILQVADIYDPSISIAEQFSELESKFIDFNTGLLMDEYNNFSIDEYDQIVVTKDPNLSSKVPSSEDIAIIKNRENVGKIYILRDEVGTIDKLVLPIRGYGLWGTLYGYISIEEDFNTVSGIEFYDHKETPGLGAEVDNPKWKAQWKGKKIYKDNKVVGRATGGEFGFRLDKSIALAMVKPDFANVGDKLQVDILGEMYDATVLEESPYDTENNLLRA